ncbi:unnamed protein product [Durusdinium trenchii]|uniref:ANK_REP_REGION domain-containing protein n=2 Tax=Durusdinium trenchii TaxID=1381693 RepID=A0ABP0LFS4_9DINO
MATTESFEFEYVGGRCKLTSDLEPISLLKGDIVVAETYKRMKQQRKQHMEEARELQKRKKRAKERQLLTDFLEKHGFDSSDVNATGGSKKTKCFGLIPSFQRPLHQACKEKNVEVIFLLLQYGADPMCKDSRGYTAYDHVESFAERKRMNMLHETFRARGDLLSLV